MAPPKAYMGVRPDNLPHLSVELSPASAPPPAALSLPTPSSGSVSVASVWVTRTGAVALTRATRRRRGHTNAPPFRDSVEPIGSEASSTNIAWPFDVDGVLGTRRLDMDEVLGIHLVRRPHV